MPGRRTVITLDLQLYIKYIQLQEKGEKIRGKFIFRMGELHTLFAMFRAVRKYIDESSLDGIFCRARMYGPNTLTGIIAGKHVKRCVDTYMTLYSNIMDIMLDDFLLENPELSVAVKTLTTRYLSLVVFKYNDDIKALHEDLVSKLTKINFYSLFSEHRKGLPGKVPQ